MIHDDTDQPCSLTVANCKFLSVEPESELILYSHVPAANFFAYTILVNPVIHEHLCSIFTDKELKQDTDHMGTTEV